MLSVRAARAGSEKLGFVLDNGSRLELRLLRYFIAVAEHEHVGRAAQQLHISASPLSRQIYQLEEEIGVRLFTRVGRRIQLTEAGKVFREALRGAFSQIDRAVAVAQAASRGEVGRLRLGFVETPRFTALLPTVLRQLSARHPGVVVDLEAMTPHEQQVALGEGRIDAALTYALGLEPTFVAADTLFSERIELILPRDHALARRRTLETRDLIGVQFVWMARDESPACFDALRTALLECGVELNTVTAASSLTARISLVASGVGVTFASPSAIERIAGVVARPLADVRVDVAAMLLLPHRPQPALQSLREIVLGAA